MTKYFLDKTAQEIPTRSKGSKITPVSTLDNKSQGIPTRDNKKNVPLQTTPSQKAVDVKNHLPLGSSSIISVQKMQKAMQELASTIMRDSEVSINPLNGLNVKSSKKAFNDFIAEQYVSSLDDDKKGTDWISTQPSKKNQTDIHELNDVMNSLRHISSGSLEFKPDGIWGPKTDNGLRNMMGFAYALLQLEGDFGLSNNIYSLKQWKSFQDNLSGYKLENNKVMLSPDEKKNRADQITTHLQAITKLYNHFRQQVSTRPEYRPLIEGNRAFEKYSPDNKSILTPEEDKIIKNPLSVVPNVKYQPPDHSKFFTSIPLSALSNKEQYLKYMSDVVGVNEQQAIDLFNKSIKSQIEAM